MNVWQFKRELEMFKPAVFILIFCCLYSVKALASPMIQYDAFSHGDSLAMLDKNSGLVWMDFGVNNGQSFNVIFDKLDGLYQEWRLPTQTEVDALWELLALSVKEDNPLAIFSIWGANAGGWGVDFPLAATGYFLDNDGYLSSAYLVEGDDASVATGVSKKIIDAKFGEVSHYLYEAGGTSELSVLLVKRVKVSVGADYTYVCIVLLIALFSWLAKILQFKVRFA